MIKKNPFKGLKLDKEEKEISKAIERSEYKATPKSKELVAEITQAVRKNLASRTVCVRVNPEDLEEIKIKAGRSGLPYQTLIKAVLHQFAKGKVSIIL